MYKVLLVDDEMPALRFLQTIIEKFARELTIAQSCLSGEAALAFLRENKVDLLITDISMSGMDGIALAHAARALQPEIHIVIVTGYAEFEYAKGAIQAAVDDYILKPVSVSHMAEVLGKIKEKLDEENSLREPAMLAALLRGDAFDEQLAQRRFGEGNFHFALVRWGNLGFSRGSLRSTSVLPLADEPFFALYGRDEDEQLIVSNPGAVADVFQEAVKAYMVRRKNTATQTAVFSRGGGPLRGLATFFTRAAERMERSVVIGRRQYISLASPAPKQDGAMHIPSATMKKLEYFILERNERMTKDLFISLAADWERRQLPQSCAASMVEQLTHAALALKPLAGVSTESVLREARDLLLYAVSYGDLMASLYAVLFDNNAGRDRKLSTEDLCDYALRYIHEKFSQPISIQNVCSEIGISQTYLSRLLRKHANTSFNAYVTQCRIEAAKKMIREHPGSPLRDVASCVGYEDYAYFSKVFHQAVGCTPSQWAGDPRSAKDD
ncbi:MAG TPA: response regulator [Candidatus Pullichristensenella excrementipullorum]|nr:response regulator [Candidatus Pullichristensenella excrementipullorum]